MPDLVNSDLGLWFAAVSCTAAAFLTAWGAMAGILRHRIPRVLLAVAVAFVAASYWVDVFHWHGAIDMRRGAAFLLWPSLAWTAWSGVVYSRKATASAENVIAEAAALFESDDRPR